MTTTWHPIPGFDGWYELSDDGRVRSWRPLGWSKHKRGRADTPRLLTPNYASGRPRYTLKAPDMPRTWLYSLADLMARCGLIGGGALPTTPPEEVDGWYNVPGYVGLYQIHTDGRVRSLYHKRGADLSLRDKPLELAHCYGHRIPCYKLVNRGTPTVMSVRTIARLFDEGHPVRVSTGADIFDAPTRRGGRGTTSGAVEDDDREERIPRCVVDEIRGAWARRHLRRGRQVTVEILADLHLLTRVQVREIIEGVEEVRA